MSHHRQLPKFGGDPHPNPGVGESDESECSG